MKRLFFIALIVCGQYANAQFNELTTPGYTALQLPDTVTFSTASIADYIISHYKTDEEKLSAIYSWVTANIEYDTDSMYAFNWGANADKRITEALRRRKGVCENYAAVFNDIVLKCGLQSYVVSGYTKQNVLIDKTGHSWCAVLLNNKWYLCDPTWDKDSRNTTQWFLISPGQFITSHMPFDPLWQLISYPVSQEEFRRGIFNTGKEKSDYNVNDSIKIFLELNEVQQRQASVRRMQQSGPGNDLLKIWMAYNQMKIGIVYEEQDMNRYNAAVADLNKASNIFNEFVEYRNNEFIPLRPGNEMISLLDPIAILVSSAFKKIDSIGKTVANFQYNTEALIIKLNNLLKRTEDQKSFLQLYLSADLKERKKLFYN